MTSADVVLSDFWGHAATSDVDIVLSIHQSLGADAGSGAPSLVCTKVIPVHSVVLERASPLWKVCLGSIIKQDLCIDVGGSCNCGVGLTVARASAICGRTVVDTDAGCGH